jgi:hypothetical protein
MYTVQMQTEEIIRGWATRRCWDPQNVDHSEVQQGSGVGVSEEGSEKIGSIGLKIGQLKLTL